MFEKSEDGDRCILERRLKESSLSSDNEEVIYIGSVNNKHKQD